MRTILLARGPVTVAGCLLFTVAVLGVGYRAFGFWTTMIFASGFLGGFLIWLVGPRTSAFSDIKIAYFLSLALFLLHRIEERLSGFFDRLQGITGVPTPEILSFEVITLVVLSVGAWLIVPWIFKLAPDVGRYLAWTLFASMGLTELAHFIFPIIVREPFAYFPGMASVFILAPIAWWGMWRLWTGSSKLRHFDRAA